MEFLKRVARRTTDTHLQVMYGIDGRRASHRANSCPSSRATEARAPVRIGNAAYDQLQLDVYGELLETAYLWSRTRALSEGTWSTLASPRRLGGRSLAAAGQRHLGGAGGTAALRAQQSDVLGGARPRHPHGARVLASGPARSMGGGACRVHADVLANGWSEAKQSFVQYYGTDALDASNLVIPMVGFLPHSDPRVVGTVQATLRELTAKARSSCTGTGTTTAFRAKKASSRSARSGWPRHSRCRVTTRSRASHLRAHARPGEPRRSLQRGARSGDRRFLGNFPQAFTHIALINCAHVMDGLQGDARDRGSASRGSGGRSLPAAGEENDGSATASACIVHPVRSNAAHPVLADHGVRVRRDGAAEIARGLGRTGRCR